MLKFQAPVYKQIIRFNPANSLEQFKKDMCIDEHPFDLRAIAVPPQELVDRTIQEVNSTSSKARKESKRLVKKYRVDNLEDWCRENWFGVLENVVRSKWVDAFTLEVASHDKLYSVFSYLAKKYNLEMYYSYVKEHDTNFENDCGIIHIAEVNKPLELSDDRFERFAFGSVLLAASPISFKTWEAVSITEAPMKYYEEHFIEENARKRLEIAFSVCLTVGVARIMVDPELNAEMTCKALSNFF